MAVKIVREETLISCGAFPESSAWQTVRRKLYKAVRAVEWPPGSGSFTIYAQSGKERGQSTTLPKFRQTARDNFRRVWIVFAVDFGQLLFYLLAQTWFCSGELDRPPAIL
jgi:hypothetical protein